MARLMVIRSEKSGFLDPIGTPHEDDTKKTAYRVTKLDIYLSV